MQIETLFFWPSTIDYDRRTANGFDGIDRSVGRSFSIAARLRGSARFGGPARGSAPHGSAPHGSAPHGPARLARSTGRPRAKKQGFDLHCAAPLRSSELIYAARSCVAQWMK